MFVKCCHHLEFTGCHFFQQNSYFFLLLTKVCFAIFFTEIPYCESLYDFFIYIYTVYNKIEFFKTHFVYIIITTMYYCYFLFRFFLHSPANPDLLYIICFCHTQITITLLLCFIFGSKVSQS